MLLLNKLYISLSVFISEEPKNFFIQSFRKWSSFEWNQHARVDVCSSPFVKAYMRCDAGEHNRELPMTFGRTEPFREL